MKRILVIAAAALCAAGAVHAQGSSSSKTDWKSKTDDMSCQEPYAPAVPKAEETSLEELRDEVRPEIEGFIKASNKYLDCIGVKLEQAKEEQDQDKMRELVKAHNDNVKYQKSVAAEFNTTVEALKALRAGLAPAGSAETSGEGEGDAQPGEAAEGAGAAEAAAEGAGGKKTAEAPEAGDADKDEEKSSDSEEAARN